MTLRRMKTYTGGQGYVYQYYFVGKREALASEANAPAEEYIFDVTSDRKTTFSVSILLPEETLKQWASTHGRGLTEAEQYGAVKMRLFQAFDQVEDMMAQGRSLLITQDVLQNVLTTLNVQ
jgi:hypothetical protein